MIPRALARLFLFCSRLRRGQPSGPPADSTVGGRTKPDSIRRARFGEAALSRDQPDAEAGPEQ